MAGLGDTGVKTHSRTHIRSHTETQSPGGRGARERRRGRGKHVAGGRVRHRPIWKSRVGRRGRPRDRRKAECGRSRETERETVLGRQGKRDEEPAMRERARVTGG